MAAHQTIGAIRRAARTEHWQEARTWLYWTIALGALPFWGVLLIWWLTSRSFEIQLLTKDAQLAVYAAGLMSSTIPAIQKTRKETHVSHPPWFLIVSILVILVAALMLGIAVVTTTSAVRPIRFLGISVLLTAISLSLGFLNELLTSIRESPDIRGMGDAALNELSGHVREQLRGDTE